MKFDPNLIFEVPWSSVPPVLLQVPGCMSSGSIRLHASNPNLSTAALGNDKADTESLDSAFDVAKLQEDFCRIATNCEYVIWIKRLTFERCVWQHFKDVLQCESDSATVSSFTCLSYVQ